ncbi:MAG TPA: hypothetical protein VN696_00435, partial [Pyrinomonadaceae bacterium]|nr:hypothetical protein [Pyrinomonadaceae bacterium]
MRIATTVTLRPVRGTDKDYKASSETGSAAEYLLDLPRGEYDLTVTARSYLSYRGRISLAGKERRTIVVTLYRKSESEEGNAVERAHAWLSDIRAYPAKRIPHDARQRAIEKKRNPPRPGPPRPPDPPSKAKWTVLGPRNISGRVRALAAHPTDGKTIFAGSANAGVWVTHDGARTWRSLWFDEDVLEIGALAIHLTDPKKPNGDVTLYAGTGTIEFADPTIFPAYPGIGILKSVKSGAQGTWVTVPVPLTDITAIVVDLKTIAGGPKTTVLYAGGSGGLYQSQNGGSAWTLVNSGNIRSLALDPANDKWLYAGVANQGIVRINRTTLAATDFNFNMAAPQYSMMVAIGQSDPFTIYAKNDDVVYRFNRNTKKWKNLGAHGDSTYGYWNECLGVDPNNSDIVLSGGVGLERSSDAGESWTEVSLDSDHHAVAFSSSDSLTVYVGNDHGVRKGSYTSADETVTWTTAHNGLILTHYNGLGASSIGPNVIGGGSQDNGTHRTVGGLTWDLLRNGDGCGFVYDPDDPYTMYYVESYSLGNPDNGDIYRSTDGGATGPTQADTTGFQGPFVTPLVIDPTSPKANRILFAGGVTKVYRSKDGGMSWSACSPNMNGEVRSLSVSPRSSKVMFAGTQVGGVWRSTNGGATTANWKKITPGSGAPIPNRRLTSVLADPFYTYGVYVTFGGLNTSTPGQPGHLFYALSKDDGSLYDWEDRSGDLPDIPAYSVAIDPDNSQRMWIGTDIGVFESNDGGLTWLADDGLPNVVVTDLRVREDKQVLRAATYGWGMWQRRIVPPYASVDVYVRDNKMDTGETSPAPYDVDDPQVVGNKLYFWESPDIKVSSDAAPVDGVEFDQLQETDLVHGGANTLYIQVHNRGWKTATNVKVRALWASGAAGLPPLPNDFWSTFPGNWSGATDWQPIDANIPFQTIPKLRPHTPKILTWSWVLPPDASDDNCVLAVISADEDPVNRSDANPDDLIVDTISVWDKHVAHRNIEITSDEIAANITSGKRQSSEITIELNNPYDAPDYFEVEIDRGT